MENAAPLAGRIALVGATRGAGRGSPSNSQPPVPLSTPAVAPLQAAPHDALPLTIRAPGSVLEEATDGTVAYNAGQVIRVAVKNPTSDTAAASCGGVPSVERGAAGVKAKLVVDDCDASKELAEGRRRLHKNLLVYPLIR